VVPAVTDSNNVKKTLKIKVDLKKMPERLEMSQIPSLLKLKAKKIMITNHQRNQT